MNKYKEAIQTIMQSVKYMIDTKMAHTTKIYDGLILSINGTNANIRINGKDYVVPSYGLLEHNANQIVKVFVPQGNMNLAFYI